MHQGDISKEFRIVLAISQVIKCHEECEMYLSHVLLAVERYREALQPRVYATPVVDEEVKKLNTVKISDFFPVVGTSGMRIYQIDDDKLAYNTWQGILGVMENVFDVVDWSDVLAWELHEHYKGT